MTKTNSDTFLMVGLGNPGPEYADTRHNAGFKTIDILASELGITYWKNECGALVGTSSRAVMTQAAAGNSVSIVLAKPQSFMNCSGGPVKQLLATYNIPIENLIVIHDELDIPAGSVRVKRGGGHAGHNGLRSIIDKLQTRDWLRVRVGIGRPPGRMDTADFVLSVPKSHDADDFSAATDTAAQAARSLVERGLNATQQEYNVRT